MGLRPRKNATIFLLTVSALFVGILAHKVSIAQEIELTIQLKDMKGWPGGAKFGIWEGGWEVNLYFNVSANQHDIISATLHLHIYAKTTGYSKAILDNLELNGYILEKDWTFAYGWFGAERDEWIDWDVPNEYVKTGENHLFIGLYFNDLDDVWEEDFVVYDLSKIVLQIRDATPPYASASLSGIEWSNDLYISGVSVTLSAEDPLSGVSSIFYKVDSGDWTQYQTPFEVSGDGRHMVYYYGIDNVGNEESEKFVSFRVDISPPTITIDSPPGDSCVAKPSVTLSWSGSDELGIDHYKIFVDGINLGNTSSTTWNFANLKEGQHTISVTAYDQVGHHNEDRVTITVDYSNPDISVIHPYEGAYVWGVVTLKANATDHLSGIDRVEVHIDNIENENMTYVSGMWLSHWDTSLFSGGLHTIRVKAVDNAGNSETSEIAVVIRQLQIEAMFSDQSPVEGEIVEAKVFVTNQEGDPVEEVQVLLKFGGWTVECKETGGGHYETAVDTTGLMAPFDIIYRTLSITIYASKDGYNSNTKNYGLSVQRPLPNVLAALLIGMGVFILPLPSFIDLLGNRFPKHFGAVFSALFCFILGVGAAYLAYSLPELILYLTGIPSLVTVIIFIILGLVLTIYRLIKTLT